MFSGWNVFFVFISKKHFSLKRMSVQYEKKKGGNLLLKSTKHILLSNIQSAVFLSHSLPQGVYKKNSHHKETVNLPNYPITRFCAAARRSANDFVLPAVAVVVVVELLLAFDVADALDDVSAEELVDFAGTGSSSLSRKSNKLPPPETMLGLGGANKGVRGVGAGATGAAVNDELSEVPTGVVRTPREAEEAIEGVAREETGDPKEEDTGALKEDEALKEEVIGAPKLEDAIGAPRVELTGAGEPPSSFPLSSM